MLHQTQVLLDRAFSERIAGNWTSAIDLYDEAYRRSIESRNSAGLMEATLSLGHCYRDMGQAELAADHLWLTYEMALLHDDAGRAARALNGLAAAYMLGGDNDRAERTYQGALGYAATAGCALTTGSIYQNLGTIANIRGELESALDYYRRSLGHYESIRHERNMSLVLNNLGMLYIDLRHFEEARRSLSRALEIAVASGDVVTQSVIHTNGTELFVALGDLERARQSCDEAFEISSRIGDNRIKAEALKFYGMIHREGGKPHLAEIHLRQAIAISAKYANPLTEAESHRELALVLRAQERNREALEALNRSHALFTALQARQDQADVGERLSQLEDDFLSVVRRWGESIEAKDRYTSGHCQRVADYACRIALAAGMAEAELTWFRMGAFLHDVGKTEVPEEILNKPGRLTAEERLQMERHTVAGHEMLSSIAFPWDVLPMVRSHHERWDGAGYPDRLVGEQIPFTARVLRLADIFDALTTTRSYREPLSPEAAFRVMEDDAGSFDPALLDVFRGLFPELRAMALAAAG